MYTDPGSGIFLTQAIMVVAMTAMYRFRYAIYNLLRRRDKPGADSGAK